MTKPRVKSCVVPHASYNMAQPEYFCKPTPEERLLSAVLRRNGGRLFDLADELRAVQRYDELVEDVSAENGASVVW